MNPKHLKTFYIGCKNTGEITTNKDNIARIPKSYNMGHRHIMGLLGQHFFSAQVLTQEGIISDPYKLTIYVTNINDKMKAENEVTKLDTLYYFIENMHPPKCGMIISIFEHQLIKSIKPYEDFRYLWPFKKEMQWVGDGDYITFQEVEPKCTPWVKEKFFSHPNAKITKDIDEHSVYPIKRIDYTMREEEIFELLKHTKFHLSYPGGTYYTAGMMNCPTIGLYLKKEIVEVDLHSPYKEGRRLIHMTMSERIDDIIRLHGYYTYNFDDNSARRDFQDYLKHVTNDELMLYLKGYA